MAQLGERLVDSGYPIIPITPPDADIRPDKDADRRAAVLAGRGKAPGQWGAAGWWTLPGWQAIGVPSPAKVQAWSRMPPCGVGIVCGAGPVPLCGVDIDVTDAPAALAIEQLARATLGETPLLRIGLAPKRLLVYRMAEPFDSFDRAPIQILARGRQFVAYGIHPKTRRPYAWPEEHPSEVDPESLPAITAAQAHAFAEAAFALVPAPLRPSRLKAGAGDAAHVGAPDRAGTYEAVADALRHIPNDDLPYDDWVRVGQALKGALGEDGEGLYLEWSARAGKDRPAFTAKNWASYRGDRAGAGTLYHLARQYGWHPAPHLALNPAGAFAPGHHPAQAFLGRIDALIRQGHRFGGDDAAPLADSVAPEVVVRERALPLPEPAGLVKRIKDLILSWSRYPQPELSLAAALVIVGTAMGRRYSFEQNIRPNLYLLGLAPSASGKNTPLHAVGTILTEAGLGRTLAGSTPASGAAVISRVMIDPVTTYVIDEFGMLLRTILDPSAAGHLREITRIFTELYTSSASRYAAKDYADRRDRPTTEIYDPSLSIMAVTAAPNLWPVVTTTTISDGSLGRFMIFEAAESYPDARRRVAEPIVPADIRDAVRRVYEMGGANDAGNLNGLPITKPSLRKVEVSVAADEMLWGFTEHEVALKRQHENDGLAAIYGRQVEHAKKLALIHAIGRDPGAAMIDISDVEWAMVLVETLTARTVAALKMNAADNRLEAEVKRVLRLIVEAGDQGIGQRDLTRRTQTLEKRRREDILADLRLAGEVEFITIKPKRGPERNVWRRARNNQP